MNTYIGNATADHLRDVAEKLNRTMGSSLDLAAVAGALRTGAAEIDSLQKRLTEVMLKVANPRDFFP